MKVDNGGLEKYMLDGDDEWLERMENVRSIFF